MTGADFKTKLLTKIGEFGLGYFNDSRLNSFIFNAVTDIIDKKVEEFQKTKKITREMQPLINVTSALTPINSQIDLSQSSVQVPLYYSLINLIVTSPYRGGSVTKVAEERRLDQFIDLLTEGIARYPRYWMQADIMNLEPSNATSVEISYFIKPIQIDVTNNVNVIPYNDKLIQLILDKTIEVIGFEERDSFSIQSSDIMQTKNP